MSYPHQLQTLIVEDEQEPIENYRKLFEDFAKRKLEVAPPVFVRSHEDAVKLLSSNTIFHLLIVDLGLPHTSHESAQAGVEPGVDLVQRAAARDNYPIPAVLVISGRLGMARLPSLTDLLKREFWHGEMVNKGIEQDDAIELAVRKSYAYCNVGIHVRDANGRLCPTLSPREDDLLRRCVLAQPMCIGLDIEWWGASPGNSFFLSSGGGGMTKVLMGRFLLQDGKDSSRPSFFKFEPRESANYSHQAVAVMLQKLSHVKQCSAMHSLSRSLLVTQQVGGSSERPISLTDFLTNKSEAAHNAIPHIVQDVVGQLSSLGTATEDRFAVSALLWQWYSLDKVEAAWKRHGGDAEGKPVNLLRALRASSREVWGRHQNCTHGDLNATNIALEAVQDGYRAYIFDAGGTQADAATRDLAMLETTVLLHLRSSSSQSLIEECIALYIAGVNVADAGNTQELSPLAKNAKRLIQEVRDHVMRLNDIHVYALMVFDCAMLQLGGLVEQSRGNKITNPRDAVRLAELAANWLLSIVPGLAESELRTP